MLELAPIGYRKNVGAVIISPNKRIWMGKRFVDGDSRNKNPWQMPQGGIESGEDPAIAIRREIFEETGIKSINYLSNIPTWITYDLPKNIKKTFWDGKYKGQAQLWFAFEFVGEDSEINLSASDVKPEFAEWQWIDSDKVTDKAIWFKREVYQQVLKEFSSHLS